MNTNEKVLYKGFHTITEVEATMKGRVVKRERLGLKSAVAGIVIDEKGRIGLVSQYRPVVAMRTWELPAGVLDKPHLTPKEVLLEELEEECCITSEQVLKVDEHPYIEDYFMVIGSSNANITFFTVHVSAQDDKQTEDDHDVDEVKWFTVEEFGSLVRTKQIKDGKTLIGYFMYKELLKERSEEK